MRMHSCELFLNLSVVGNGLWKTGFFHFEKLSISLIYFRFSELENYKQHTIITADVFVLIFHPNDKYPEKYTKAYQGGVIVIAISRRACKCNIFPAD